jgi:hypothetical protein
LIEQHLADVLHNLNLRIQTLESVMGLNNYNKVKPDRQGLYMCHKAGEEPKEIEVSRVGGVFLAKGEGIDMPVSDMDGYYFYGAIDRKANAASNRRMPTQLHNRSIDDDSPAPSADDEQSSILGTPEA